MNNQPIIKFKNVGCRYRIKQGFCRFKNYDALKDVSLTLYKGETLGVIGKNGAGKSTLLRLMAGIILPGRGCIWQPPDISVSLLSFSSGFSTELSGMDNVILLGMLLGFSKKDIMAGANKIVAFAELEEFIDNPLKTYSSGMRARLGFSVALELIPDILLVDEVLAVGDTAFRKKAFDAMRKKIASELTVVFVSHNMETVTELCQRAVWLENGKTKMEGPTAEVIRAYTNSEQT